MKITNLSNPAAPTLFASVRRSHDRALVAFGAALLTAFALHAGAFVPRLASPGAPRAAPELRAATPAPGAAAVAATPVPCELPRG